MNLTNIKANNLNILDNMISKGQIDFSFFLNEGDTLEGIVAENNKVVIELNGKKITINNPNPGESKAGDVKQYEVLDSGMNKLVLEEKKNNTGINEKIDINEKINSKEMQLNYQTQEIKKSLVDNSETVVDSEMEKQLTDKLDKAVIVMSPEEIRAIEAEGKNIEDMEIEEIYSKISRLKREKLEKEYKNCGNVDKNVDNSSSWNNNALKNVDKIDNLNGVDNVVRKQMPKMGIIIENTDFKAKVNDKIQLKYFDEPVESSEIIPEEISRVVEEIFDGNDKGFMSLDAIKYIIQNDLEHTLDNLYKAKYAGSKIVTHNIADDDFEQLLSQVKDVITNAGYDINEYNIDVAKWIIECDIPLNEDTFEEYFQLRNLNRYNKNDINEIINDYVIDEVPIENMIISYVDKSEIEDAINNYNRVTDEAIENVIKENGVINLKNLVNSQRNILEQLANNPNVTEMESDNITGSKYLNVYRTVENTEDMERQTQIDSQVVTARRQLEEIRLKLTLEASNKLALKGFNIATEELEVVVEELRNIEKAFNSKYPVDLKDNYSGQKMYEDVSTKVSAVKEMSGYVLATTYPLRDKITIQGLYDEGQKSDYSAYKELNFKISRNVDRFNETFETIMTAPRKDMGDSIQKAFRNVDDILKDLDMELTDFNRRAVRILGYNNTDITKENIASVKLYDYEVNEVLADMTPARTIELIKRNKNPLNMTLEELASELVDIKSSIIDETNDSYSKYLWKLDKHSKLSQKERDAYIGIYRLIHKVEKTDGAVIGAIMNSGKELTLRNLLTEARVRENKGINANIDDMFGAIESIETNGKMIDGQIDNAFIDNELKLNKKIFNNIAENITPSVMEHAVVDKMDIMNMPMEQVLQYIEEQKEKEEVDTKYYEYKVSTLRKIADNSSEAVKLLTRLGMETTMSNVIAASETLLGNGLTSTFKKFLKIDDKDKEIWSEEGSIETVADVKKGLLQKAAEVIETLDERDKLSYSYTEMETDIKTIINAYKENYTVSDFDIEELRSMNRNITFAGKMSRKECYEIPLITGNDDNLNVTNINLTIIRNSNKQEVSINTNSELIGKIEARFTYKNNQVKGLVLGDNVSGIELLKDNYNSFKDKLTELDINLKQLDYGINNKINYTFAGKDINDNNIELSTSTLYSLAKALIINIKETQEQVLAQS